MMYLNSGPILLTNTYQLNFNRSINYCSEIKFLFEKIHPILNSNINVIDLEDKDLSISLSHHTPIVSKETDLVLLYFTDIYYDCDVNIYANDNLKYIIKIIDGFVKNINWVMKS